MPRIAKMTGILTLALLGSATAAGAANLGDSSSYNTPWGMSSGAQENAPVNASLRDSNGNLEVVNGQFATNAFAQSYGMAGSTASASGLGSTTGVQSSGAAYGGATAIGNQLNVVTVGSGNTVIVNARQTNNGNQTANTSVNGH